MNVTSVRAKCYLIATVAAAAMTTGLAQATPIIFSGSDIVSTTGSPHPTATAAAASFDAAAAALGTVGLITFEGQPLGAFNNLSVASGVSISGTDFFGANQTIRNTSNSPSFPTLDGFNTTSGGAFFVEIKGGVVTFSFSQPTQFFGAYFTGVQTNFFTDTVTFSDGTSMSVPIPGPGTSGSTGAVAFVGIIDAGRFISSFSINAGDTRSADFIGTDDVRYQLIRTAAVPEPASIALVGLGLGAAFAFRRRRRTPAN